MNKYLNSIGIIIALTYLVESFTEGGKSDIFGFELNIWVFRFIWTLLLGFMVYEIYKGSKKNYSKNNGQ